MTSSSARRPPRYGILRQLSQGPLTNGFLASPRAPRPPELVVLELLRSELREDDAFRAQFLDQAALTLALDHPNVVRTLEVLAGADSCGLSFEFLDGQTLSRVLSRLGRQRFPVDMHLHVLRQVLRALEYTHRLGAPGGADHGPLHRDVCPSNVFITYTGQVKLLGAGFAGARLALENRLGCPLSDVRYAAPEVLLRGPAGPAADLFGVGMMVWEAAARQARTSADRSSILHRRIHGGEPDLESVWTDAPAPIVGLCARALAVSPIDRYPSARAFRADLDAYLRRAGEASEAVLARLGELMRSAFADEREQMRRFTESSLAPQREGPSAADGEPLPEDAEWDTPTNVGHRSLATDQLSAGSVGAAASDVASGATSPRLYDTLRDGAVLRAPAGGTPASGAAPPRKALAETTTAGHRAYAKPILRVDPRRRAWLGPDVLGAAALILGALVAGYSVHRHTSRTTPVTPGPLAVRAEVRPAAPASPSVEAELAGLPPVAPAERVDAGAPPESAVSPSAFFGEATTRQPSAAPLLRADELPTLDPELSSLQDAIVAAARARRRPRRKPQREMEAPLVRSPLPSPALPKRDGDPDPED